MLTTKKMTLKPLLVSEDGVHLTAYLINRGFYIDLKIQLRRIINEAKDILNPIMPTEEISKFLDPLDKLLEDARIFKQMKGNIGIFRNQNSFRVLNLPVDVEQTLHVATSFHVKPLLRWLQSDEEFLFLGLEKHSAHLYLGSQDTFKLIDSILFPESFKSQNITGDYDSLKKSRRQKANQTETFVWLNDWISELTKNTKLKLFLAGETVLLDRMHQNLKYKNVIAEPVTQFFDKSKLTEACSVIRKTLKSESKLNIEKALLEFRFAEEGRRTRNNIFQIARAVVRGRVKKLIISADLNIFGKIDKKSGGLSIHPYDLDHEDDDILDDLAQMVIKQGGEVIVAAQNDIPKARPILAILNDEEKELEKASDFKRNILLIERIA